MPGDPGPLARRRQLGSTLRQYRLDAHLSVKDVAEQLLCSPSKISRIETAQRNATLRDVRDLCNLYGITNEATREQLMRLARESRETAWWQRFDLNPALARYVGLEASATRINDFQIGVIPGLLQTREYARAILEKWIANDPTALEEALDVRMKRQEVVTTHNTLRAVIDESVVRRLVGGPGVMRNQIDRLIELSGSSHIELRVLPFASGAHKGLISGFTALQFETPAPLDSTSSMSDIVYVEGIVDGLYFEQPAEVALYLRIFDDLRASAMTTNETIELLKSILREM